MWTLSSLQLHPHPMIVVDEDATLELQVKTVKVSLAYADIVLIGANLSPVLQEYRHGSHGARFPSNASQEARLGHRGSDPTSAFSDHWRQSGRSAAQSISFCQSVAGGDECSNLRQRVSKLQIRGSGR
jgi:hypothetical protein